MGRLIGVIITVMAVLGLASTALAFGLPSAYSLPQDVYGADAVVIFKVDSLTLKPKPVPQRTGMGFSGPQAFIAISTFEGEGLYEVTMVRNIKGEARASLSINFPPLTTLGYPSVFHLKAGDYLVAFLRKGDNGWVPQDPIRPFVPLFQTPDLTNSPSEPLQQVELLILPELKDEATRLMAVDLLSSTSNPKVLVALSPYIEDQNLRVRDLVLTTYARNQQVSAIPRIRDLNRLTSAQRSNPQALTALRSFVGVKEALPLLNPLLFEDEQFMRVNALDTLSQSKDASILPFLLLTLYDPEPQKANAPEAYAMFAQMPGVKLGAGAGDFALHPAQARKEAWAWWRDELAGKHPHKEDDKDRIVLNEGETHEAKELPQLNEGLFMRSQYTRLAAVEALNKLADQSSVPYLIIALRDPNGDVAYGAHHVLARLVPALGPYLPRATFDASRAKLADTGVAWWIKHLQDAEEARLPEFLRTGHKTAAK